MPPPIHVENFDYECYLCGAVLTVEVLGHVVLNTQLCGPHFFNDANMTDPELWNDFSQETQDET